MCISRQAGPGLQIRVETTWDSRHVLRLCLHVAAPHAPRLRTRLRRRPTRMWPAVPVHHRLPSFCMLSLGWPRDSPGCRSLAASALWILVVRFLPSTGRGRSPVGTLEQHCDSAGPGRQLTTVSASGWPLARPWGGSRFRRCRRRWPSAGPGSACGRGGMPGLDRETPGFHPEAVLVLIPRAPN